MATDRGAYALRTWQRSGRGTTVFLRGFKHGLNDSFVAGATAQIPPQCLSHILFSRIGITAQKGRCGHQEAGSAKATLQRMLTVKALLQSGQVRVLG
jgi:hypothetical protein